MAQFQQLQHILLVGILKLNGEEAEGVLGKINGWVGGSGTLGHKAKKALLSAAVHLVGDLLHQNNKVGCYGKIDYVHALTTAGYAAAATALVPEEEGKFIGGQANSEATKMAVGAAGVATTGAIGGAIVLANEFINDTRGASHSFEMPIIDATSDIIHSAIKAIAGN